MGSIPTRGSNLEERKMSRYIVINWESNGEHKIVVIKETLEEAKTELLKEIFRDCSQVLSIKDKQHPNGYNLILWDTRKYPKTEDRPNPSGMMYWSDENANWTKEKLW